MRVTRFAALAFALAFALSLCAACEESCPPAGCGTCGDVDIETITAAAQVSVVVHNEEDVDPEPGEPSSHIPDYNGDPAVFEHFADAMMDLAQMLAGHGVPLSFQPDWTFTEGVELYRPDFYVELLALGNTEVVPHVHETVVMYDELEPWLAELGAEPQPLIGGMRFDTYLTRQAWFDGHPGVHFWGAPAAGDTHPEDAKVPPVVLRIAEPEQVEQPSDLLVHRASSPVIATPGPAPHGVPTDVDAWLSQGPEGPYLRPAYLFLATRWFKAETGDESVPAEWTVHPDPPEDVQPKANRSSAEWLTMLEALIVDELEPRRAAGAVRYTTVGELVELYETCEPCLSPADGEDLSQYAITMFDFGGQQEGE